MASTKVKKPLTWHNVKPTPPGTVKMLTQMSEEIERYMQAVKRD